MESPAMFSDEDCPDMSLACLKGLHEKLPTLSSEHTSGLMKLIKQHEPSNEGVLAHLSEEKLEFGFNLLDLKTSTLWAVHQYVYACTGEAPPHRRQQKLWPSQNYLSEMEPSDDADMLMDLLMNTTPGRMIENLNEDSNDIQRFDGPSEGFPDAAVAHTPVTFQQNELREAAVPKLPYDPEAIAQFSNPVAPGSIIVMPGEGVEDSNGFTNYSSYTSNLNMWNENIDAAHSYGRGQAVLYPTGQPVHPNTRSHPAGHPTYSNNPQAGQTFSGSITTTWSCPQCTYDNKLDAVRCGVCATSKPVLPSSSRADDGWAERFGSFKVNVEMQMLGNDVGSGTGAGGGGGPPRPPPSIPGTRAGGKEEVLSQVKNERKRRLPNSRETKMKREPGASPESGKLESGANGTFQCPTCGKMTRCQSELDSHMRTHTGEKPLVCKFPGCGKSYAHSSNLRAHERTHSKTMPHQCPRAGCNKSFRHAVSLKEHLWKHDGVQPYKCDFPGCGKRFGQISNFARHQKSHRPKDETVPNAKRRK